MAGLCKTLMMLIVVLGWIAPARGDLSGPLPPETPAADDMKHSKPGLPQSHPAEPASSGVRPGGPAANRAALKEPPAGGPSSLTESATNAKTKSFAKFAFEDLMDAVTSTRQMFPSAWRNQFQTVGMFAKLTLAERKILAPRLLAELKNEAELLGNKDLVDAAPLQVRHVADLALTRVAGVYFGQFPAVADRDAPAGQAELDRQAAEKLLGQWADWWRQVQDADEAAWAATASRLRMPLLESSREDLASLNMLLVAEQSDVKAWPVLAKLLGGAEIKEVGRYDTMLNQFMALCSQKDAPREARLFLVEFLRKNDSKEFALRTQWPRSVGGFLNKLTGVGADFLESRDVDFEQNGQKFHLTAYFVKKEALAAWEKALQEPAGDKSETPKEESNKSPKSDKKPATTP